MQDLTPTENPLLEGLRLRRIPEPCIVTIFGASGDLTQRKLLPALYSLAFHGYLPKRFAVLGVSRTEMSDEEFRERMRGSVEEHGRDEVRDDVWDALAAGMRYVAADFASEDGQRAVAELLAELDSERGTAGNRVLYLSLPPSGIESTVVGLARLPREGWRRLIVEKPFGHDLESARRLNAIVQDQIGRASCRERV